MYTQIGKQDKKNLVYELVNPFLCLYGLDCLKTTPISYFRKAVLVIYILVRTPKDPSFSIVKIFVDNYSKRTKCRVTQTMVVVRVLKALYFLFVSLSVSLIKTSTFRQRKNERQKQEIRYDMIRYYRQPYNQHKLSQLQVQRLQLLEGRSLYTVYFSDQLESSSWLYTFVRLFRSPSCWKTRWRRRRRYWYCRTRYKVKVGRGFMQQLQQLLLLLLLLPCLLPHVKLPKVFSLQTSLLELASLIAIAIDGYSYFFCYFVCLD